MRADLLELYRIFEGMDRLRVDYFFVLDGNCLRGHSRKLFKKRFRLDVVSPRRG